MKKLILMLVFCIVGCQTKTEKELEALQAQANRIRTENVMWSKKLKKNRTEALKAEENWNRSIVAHQEINERTAKLQEDIRQLENKRAVLLGATTEELNQYSAHKNDKPIKKIYIMKIKVGKTSWSLDPFDHIKDAWNAVDLEIPVDEEFYNHHQVGEKLASEFRMGSAILRGTYGSTDVKVTGKRIETIQ